MAFRMNLPDQRTINRKLAHTTVLFVNIEVSMLVVLSLNAKASALRRILVSRVTRTISLARTHVQFLCGLKDQIVVCLTTKAQWKRLGFMCQHHPHSSAAVQVHSLREGSFASQRIHVPGKCPSISACIVAVFLEAV